VPVVPGHNRPVVDLEEIKAIAAQIGYPVLLKPAAGGGGRGMRKVAGPDELGEIAVKAPDPVMFLEYWRNPEATRDKFIKDWSCTGDLAKKDEDGYFWFVGRKDDLITSSGYRIGPAEIEDCLIKHPAVTMAAVIGSPDKVRGEIVKAFIVLKQEITPSAALQEEIQIFVKTRLAAHEYPREIEFVQELPMTTTGKIMRRELRKRDMEKKGVFSK
ncbi:MAG: AMP-binding protein, partial [Deltaproteobacteria bacterium]|nr:AMP-binding protein [Deltaproteobacteria bacterium]